MHHPTILKKLLAIWGVLLLALTSVGYFYYRDWQREMKQSDFLPYLLPSSALVLDLPAVGKQWTAFQETTIGQDLQVLPCCRNLASSLVGLQQVGVGASVVRDLPAVISIHRLGEEEVGYMIYLDLRRPGVATLVNAITQPQKGTLHEIETRNYLGHLINSISFGQGKTRTTLYLLKQQHHAIISSSEVLLEDTARGLSRKEAAAFLKLQKTTHKQGSVFVNFGQLTALLRVFLTQEGYARWAAQLVGALPQAQLELQLTDHYLLFNGLITNCLPSADKLYWHQALSSETPKPFGLAPYIPAQTAVIQQYAIHDPVLLAKGMQVYRHQQMGGVGKKKQPASGDDAASLSALRGLIKNEVALCTLGTASQEQVLFMEAHQVEDAIATLEAAGCITYAPTHQLNKLSTIYTINPTACRTWLPQLLFPSFTPLFLSTIDNYLVIANGLAALQVIEAAYLQGATWEQQGSVQHQFLNSTLEAATYRIMINMQAARESIATYLKPAWKALWEKKCAKLCSHGYVGIQVTRGGTQELPADRVTVLLAHMSERIEKKAAEVAEVPTASDAATDTSTSFFKADAPITVVPMLGGEYKKRGDSFFLVQDTLHQLYLVGPTGKLFWKQQLDGPVLPDVLLVDLEKNNKWQYLCATATSVHVIDQAGNEVLNFPRQLLGKEKGTCINLIDYNRDKNYRILITDANGNIYLKDTEYRPLPGWNPKALQAPFATSPVHVRVDKDYFIALQEKGILHVLNRRGQSYPGFPIRLGASTHSPVVIQSAQSVATTRLVVLTDAGKLNVYSLQGKLQTSVQLAKTPAASKFTLVPSQEDKECYVILQQTVDKLRVLNERGKVLFERPCEADQTLLGQYYDYGSSKFYVITDPEKGKTYIYDEQGKLIHDPFNSNYPVQLFWASLPSQLTVYTTFGKQMHKYQQIVTPGASPDRADEATKNVAHE